MKANHILTRIIFAAAALCCMAACNNEKTFRIDCLEKYNIAGAKIAVRDINPDLPANWDDYNFVVLEYKISTSQRFQLGFDTEGGYNALTVMSYCPGAWNRLAIPLKFFTHEPGAAIDLAATYNQPRFTGWINLGGTKRGPMHQVDSIGFRMYKPIGDQTIEIRNLTLSVDDPGDLYMGDKPAIDSLGQSNLLEYEGKVHSLEELRAEWKAEDESLGGGDEFGYSRFGGYLCKNVGGTGFFRTAKIDGRWWFVDPEGYLFLSVGADCISLTLNGIQRGYEQRSNMYQSKLPEGIQRFGEWNVIRRYGPDYKEKALDNVIRRMEAWGLNTIGNWSAKEVMDSGRKAFMVTLGTAGVQPDLMGLADIYGTGFEKELDEAVAKSVAPYRDNQWVIGYFMGNEPAWIGREVRLCGMILDGKDRPIKAALKKHLNAKGDSDDSRREFIQTTFEKYIKAVKAAQLRHDPNHLNLGYRFGNLDSVSERVLKACAEAFDVLSFNCYGERPRQEMMDRAFALTDRPMIIGEYHFGTVDRGLAQSLIQVNSQEERGMAYRYYTEQAYAHPGLIGTAYFQWADQDITGRKDGENYNCGLIDVTDRPYKEQVSAMKESAKVLFGVHAGTIPPYSQRIERMQTHGNNGDGWNI